MDPTQIQHLLENAREDEAVELKRALPRGRRHLRTLCAFANGRGGTLLVGVDDRGGVIGVSDPGAVAQTLEEELRRHMRPRPLAQVAIVRTASSAPSSATVRVVVVRVRPGADGPYSVRLPGGGWQSYVRERDRTVPVTGRAADRVANPDRAALPDDPKLGEALRLLARSRSLTRQALARTLNLSSRRMSRLLTALVRAGLAIEHTEPREPTYALTPQGRHAARTKLQHQN